MKFSESADRHYTISQARLLLDILQYHNAETLKPSYHRAALPAINEALEKLRLDLEEYIARDDGLGWIVPSRDEKGLL